MGIEEELNGAPVELEGEGLEEGDIIGQHLLITEVKAMDDEFVDVIVRKQIICSGEED